MENQEITYQIYYQTEAEEDLKEIAEYYDQVGGKELAETNIDRILNSIDGLQFMPQKCQVSDFSPNIRRLTVFDLPYLVFFKIIDDTVYILNIFHAKRNLKTIANHYKNT